MENTIGYLLSRAANIFPEKNAIIFGDRRFTYRELNDRVNSLANAFLDMGARKGGKIGLLLDNGDAIIESYFASAKIGAVTVPLSPRLAPPEIHYILDRSDAEILVFDQKYLKTVESLRSQITKIKRLIMVGNDPLGNIAGFESLFERYHSKEPEVEIKESDICLIMYTGGTTGLPKGCILTHRNLVWVTAIQIKEREYTEEDVALVCLPLYHGVIHQVPTFVAIGATIVVIEAFDARKVLEVIQRERITTVILVPTMAVTISELPDLAHYNVASVRNLLSGAAALVPAVNERISKLFPNIRGIRDTYGQTEATTAVISTLKPQDSFSKVGSVGRPCIYGQIRIVDDQDRDVPLGEVGEIIFRGPTVMQGYYKEPKLTEEALRGGWLHTDDMGKLDDEGYLYIVGRKKDMIVSGGLNIYHAEVERVLYMHPEIVEAAVIGVPDARWGESVKAVVSLKKGRELTEEEIIGFCQLHLASYKKPKSIEFVDCLPKTQAGKIDKKKLKEMYSQPIEL